MSAISSIAGLWMEGTLRTLDALRTGFGTPAEDPPAATPYSVIYEGGKVRLRHYEARGAAQRTPILLIYSLIKRPFILDLQPGRSVVENLTGQGFDVYMIDWIPPAPADSGRGFDAYVNEDVGNAVRAVQIHRGVEQVSLVGYCFGGLLALLYTALHPNNVKNLVTLTLPLDMSVRQLPIDYMSRMLGERTAEMLVETYGNVPPWMMFSFFNTLAPTHHALDKFVGAYRSSSRNGYMDTFRLFERWLHSDVPFAGKIFLETNNDLGIRNALMKGEMVIGAEKVDLQRVECPTLNVIGDLDDIVHPKSSAPLPEMIGSTDKLNLHHPTGHMGAAVSGDAHKRLWPQVGKWLKERDA
jgi:poly[(R)-3-hydroxyalkanoate] polymerase subunit PhaC